MKAIDPAAIRPVKVKSLNGMDERQVQEQMLVNSSKGLIPQWKEIPENDTPELDTETIFSDGNVSRHQMTVPLPMDDFPNVLSRKSAMDAFQYAKIVCDREGWTVKYRNILAVLNQLEMDLEYC